MAGKHGKGKRISPRRSNRIDSRAKLPNHLPSAEELALLKGYMEEAIAKCPVHTPDCGHPSLGRDIEDCDLCWAIAAMESLYMALRKMGADDELISLNYDMLLNCYEEEKTGYPYIIKKAFKYIKEHNVCKHAYYPESKPDIKKLNVPEEVKALRICGFQMVENDDEFEIMPLQENGQSATDKICCCNMNSVTKSG